MSAGFDRLVKWPDPTPLAVLCVTDFDLKTCQSHRSCLNQPWQKVRPELLIARSAVSTAHLLTAQRFQSDAPGFVNLFVHFSSKCYSISVVFLFSFHTTHDRSGRFSVRFSGSPFELVHQLFTRGMIPVF